MRKTAKNSFEKDFFKLPGFYPDDGLLWKYIFHVYDGAEQLFCLTHDPHETYDVSEAKPDILKYWRNFQKNTTSPFFLRK